MAKTNRERVGNALEVLSAGLAPFVEAELRAWVKKQGQGDPDGWFDLAVVAMTPPGKVPFDYSPTDVQFQLKAMQVLWDGVFRETLSREHRSYIHELLDVRNKWAHQEPFSADDTYRALDTMQRLLVAVAAEEAAEIERRKHDLMRTKYEEQTKKAVKESADLLVEGKASGGALPWRDVIVPHEDVATGRYSQAEFAADLAQVWRGEGSDEYRDPREFFRRTYLTEGLRRLLCDAVLRLTGTGGDPIVDLQTNFGGGKTHSLLVLYHLFSGAQASNLTGVEEVLSDGALELPSDVRRAVLVGTWLSPAQAHTKPDGTEIRTLWGELAWQLGGQDGFALVAEADRNSTSPGADVIDQLLGDGPNLILIDEWVAYARMLYGKDDLPGGTFDTHFSFAQSLTEAAKASPRTLLLVSLPASDARLGADGEPIGSEIEVGGEGGREALVRLKNVIARTESPWQPATSEESFEIVRRRLFKDLADTQAHTARDATARTFSEYYRANEAEFPSECREADYEKRVVAAYPIHPELFDRLYEDWSTLERFQRTRGVLRLMAAVIHYLWDSGDQSPLIMPASVPIAAPDVFSELTRYLEDNWRPVIETDVDGDTAIPRRLDKDNPNLGKFQACRRVARTVYLGSAPTAKTKNRGIDDRRIKLGSALPGESPAVFGDALRRLTDHATHLYVDETRRYWFSTQPSVAQLARDRAGQYDTLDHVHPEILKHLRTERERGAFPAVQIAPTATAEVPDDPAVRLVVLGPNAPRAPKSEKSPAEALARQFLEQRGNSPRRYRNMVVFAAADASRLDELDAAVRQVLAWQSIWDDRVELNLDQFGMKQAQTKLEGAQDTVRQRIPTTYEWILVPEQQDPTGEIGWQAIRVGGNDPIAVRASKKLQHDGLMVAEYGATLLRRDLDRIPLWRGDHVQIRQLWEDYAQYPYLQRLPDIDALLAAIAAGVGSLAWTQETFAYAEDWDEDTGRYRGLQAGQQSGSILADGYLVKPEVALRQIEAEQAQKGGAPASVTLEIDSATHEHTAEEPTLDVKAPPRRFHGHVTLEDPVRLGAKAGEIAEYIVAQLAKHTGTDVTVTVEIEAASAEGFPDDTIRTVTENATTLKFDTHGFETE